MAGADGIIVKALNAIYGLKQIGIGMLQGVIQCYP